MKTDGGGSSRAGDDPESRPGIWAAWLQVAGLGSLGVAILYGLGFLVHLGHSYLLGFLPGSPTALDTLRFAGQFLFQCLQALATTVLSPTRMPWPGTSGLGPYLTCALVLLAAEGLLASSRLRLWQKRQSARRHLWRAARAVVTVGVAVFTIFWLVLLTRPFDFHDLLFPIGRSFHDQRHAAFVTELANFDAMGGTTEQQRRDHQKTLLRSTLLSEFATTDQKGDPGQSNRVGEFTAWLLRSPAEKNSALGGLLLTTTVSVLLLVGTALRLPRVRLAGGNSLRRLWSRTCQVTLALAILVQTVTIPFDFGILLVERKVPWVRVRVDGAADLERRELLLLGIDGRYHYLYSPGDFWTVYAVPDANVREIRVMGTVPVLSWMSELVPEP